MSMLPDQGSGDIVTGQQIVGLITGCGCVNPKILIFSRGPGQIMQGRGG